MSNKRIRDIFNQKLITQMFEPVSGLLIYPVIIDGMIIDESMLPDRSHIVTRLAASPSFSSTLAGREHTCYNGIYRMTLKSYDLENGFNDIDRMIEMINEAFHTDMMLTDASGFSVQVTTPLSAPDAIVVKEGSQWWEVRCSFEYRADVYTPSLRDPNTP